MNKYNAQKTEIDNITFDSYKEGSRYMELKMLEKGKVIKELVLQPRFELQPAYEINGRKVRKIEYVADFMYYDTEKNKTVIEDVKGYRTDVYKLKKKWFEYKYNMEVTEL